MSEASKDPRFQEIYAAVSSAAYPLKHTAENKAELLPMEAARVFDAVESAWESQGTQIERKPQPAPKPNKHKGKPKLKAQAPKEKPPLRKVNLDHPDHYYDWNTVSDVEATHPPKDGTWVTAYNALKHEDVMQFDQTAFGGKGGWFDKKGHAKQAPKMWRIDDLSADLNGGYKDAVAPIQAEPVS
jgi:hypothetical protein